MSVRKRLWSTNGVEKSAWMVDYFDQQSCRRGLHAWAGYRTKQQRSRYLLLKLGAIFEAYADECLRALQNHRSYDSSNGEYGEQIGRLPGPLELPDMPDVWPLVKPGLADRCMHLPIINRRRNRDVGELWELNGYDDGDLSAKYHCEAGLEAIILSRDIRSSVGLKQTAAGEDIYQQILDVWQRTFPMSGNQGPSLRCGLWRRTDAIRNGRSRTCCRIHGKCRRLFSCYLQCTTAGRSSSRSAVSVATDLRKALAASLH